MKRFFVLCAIALALIAAAAIFFLLQPKPQTMPLAVLPASEPREFEKIDRSAYKIPLGVFSDLPEIPKDFLFIKSLFEENRIGLDFVSAAYYLQPEFYPNFSSDGLPYWLKPEPERWGIVGYGVYPGDKAVSARPGETARVSTILRSGFGVRTFQGVRLEESLPAGAEKFFAVKFREKTFLLGPSYPSFSRDWAKKIEMEIDVSPETPKGNYVIGFDVARPPKELSDKWLQQYKGFYSEAAAFSQRKPLFQLFLEVK